MHAECNDCSQNSSKNWLNSTFAHLEDKGETDNKERVVVHHIALVIRDKAHDKNHS